MKIKIILGLLLSSTVYAQGCVVGGLPTSQARYVCFDGRTIEKTDIGWIWNAKRGCFVSALPCCEYNATHYAYNPNSKKLSSALGRCRHDYPFNLGQMQNYAY